MSNPSMLSSLRQSRMTGTRLIALCVLLLVSMTEFMTAVHGIVNLGPFCEKANNVTSTTGCPDVSTFDIVDTAAYAGMWYEIGSTAQFKLLTEAGLDCLRVNYTLQPPPNDSTFASLDVMNTGVQSLGAIATLGVTSISTGAKDVCMGARNICSYLAPPSALTQSLTELRKVSDTVRILLPNLAATLDDVAEKAAGYGYNISKEFTMLAEHVTRIQTFDAYLSAGNGTATANVEQIKLDIIAISKHIEVFVEFVHEMATARTPLGQVAVKLVLAGEFVSSVDVTEASALIATAEQSIILHAQQMKASLSAMNAASEVLLADPALSYQNVPWSLPGIATRNATASGRLEFSILGLSDPYWIIALEGVPSRGYDAALVYSCTENHLLGTVQQGFFILSRRPTILPAVLDRFLAVASSMGIDLGCDNPFLTSGCNTDDAAPTSTLGTCDGVGVWPFMEGFERFRLWGMSIVGSVSEQMQSVDGKAVSAHCKPVEFDMEACPHCVRTSHVF